MCYDGVCCRLIDKLSPGKISWSDKTFQVPKIEAMRIMRERERIAMFTKLVQEYGVPDAATFPTESLHEKGALNLAQVCVCLRTLGIQVAYDISNSVGECNTILCTSSRPPSHS